MPRPCVLMARRIGALICSAGPIDSSVLSGNVSSSARNCWRSTPSSRRTTIFVCDTPISDRSSRAYGNTAIGVGSSIVCGPSTTPTKVAVRDGPVGSATPNSPASPCSWVYVASWNWSPSSAPAPSTKLGVATNSPSTAGSTDRPLTSLSADGELGTREDQGVHVLRRARERQAAEHERERVGAGHARQRPDFLGSRSPFLFLRHLGAEGASHRLDVAVRDGDRALGAADEGDHQAAHDGDDRGESQRRAPPGAQVATQPAGNGFHHTTVRHHGPTNDRAHPFPWFVVATPRNG